MDQGSICLFLAMKRLLAQAIYDPAIDHEQIWLRPGGTPPERASHTIQDRKIMVTIAWNPLEFPLSVALPKGCTFNAQYHRDNSLAAPIQLQRTTGENSLFMLTMQGLTLLKNAERFAKEMDCGSLPIHPTHLISHHPSSFCSGISRNISKECYFHHTMNYLMQLMKW
jgi:hypothetical protein